MFRFDADKSVHFCDGMRRRDFLHAGSLALLGFTMQDFLKLQAAGAVDTSRDVNCIMLMLVGGPSHLDTWDMKPDAPSEIRGPYRAIPTNVDGIQISEIFPRMAKHADKYALLRSVYHTGAGVHDVGHQYMQTGRFFQFGNEQPHIGCVLSKLKGPKGRSEERRVGKECRSGWSPVLSKKKRHSECMAVDRESDVDHGQER